MFDWLSCSTDMSDMDAFYENIYSKEMEQYEKDAAHKPECDAVVTSWSRPCNCKPAQSSTYSREV